MSEPAKNDPVKDDKTPPAPAPAVPGVASGPTGAAITPPAAPATPAPAPAPAAPASAAAAPAPPKPVAPPAPPPSPSELKRLARVAHEKDVVTKLATRLGDLLTQRETFRDQETLVVSRSRALEALKIARDEHGFNCLMDVTAVDYLKLEGHPERFAVLWNLLSTRDETRLRFKAYLPEEDPRVGTASDLWPSADWGEREVFDMFGIEFTSHPDLRRMLMPADYAAFPLRKDYPLRGRGERDNFVVIKRGQREAEV